MKKATSIFVVLIMVLALLPATVFARDTISVTANGQAVVFADQGPVIVDGRTLVPVAGVFQALGFGTQWNAETRQVTITRGVDTIVVTVGSNVFTTNYVPHSLDVPAQIINGRTMLPIASVLRSVGYEVNWDGATSTVVIVSEVTYIPTIPVPDVVVAPTPLPLTEQTLVGLWDYAGITYFVFESDGTGTMLEQSIGWQASSGILVICITPEQCQSICSAPVEWYYTIEGSNLTLNSLMIPDAVYTLTRVGTAAPIMPESTPQPTPTPQPTHAPQPTPTPQPTPPQTQGVDLNQTVWLAGTGGTIYHRINNCGNMNPNNASSLTRGAARNRGARACRNCW